MSDDEHKNLIEAIQYYHENTSYKGAKKEAYIDGLNTAKALIDHNYLLSKHLSLAEKT